MRRAAIAWVAVLASGWCAADEQAQIDFANGLFARGFNEEAADEYRTYLETYPQGAHVPEARYRLGEAELAQGNAGPALAAFQAFLDAHPDHALAQTVRFRKGVALHQLQRFPEAIETLRGVGDASDPELAAGARYFLGKAQMDAGQPGPAVDAFRALANRYPDSPYAPAGQYQMAFALLAQNNVEAAAVAFSELGGLDTAPEALRSEARLRAAEAYDKIGWYDQAVHAYEELRRDFPKSDQADRAVEGHAWALYHAKRYEEAAILAQESLNMRPDSPVAAGLQYLIGNCYQQTGALDRAVTAFAAVRERFPDTDYAARALYKQGFIRYSQSNYADAETQLKAYLESGRAPEFQADALYLRGRMAQTANEYDWAVAHLEASIEADPPGDYRPDAMYQLGVVRFEGRDHAGALAALEAMLAAYPEHAMAGRASLLAGDAAFHADQYDVAQRHYAAAIERVPDGRKPDATYRLALAQQRGGDAATSVETLRGLIEGYPESSHVPSARIQIGSYLLRDAAKPLEAIPYFEEVLAGEVSAELRADATKGLALARYETHDLDGAAKTFVDLIKEWPDEKLNESTYAWVAQHLFDREDFARARVALTALLKNVPDYPNPERVHLKIGECAEKGNAPKAAIEAYTATVKAAPRSSEAFEARLRLGAIHQANDDPAKAAEYYRAAAEESNGHAGARARFMLADLLYAQESFEEAARNYMRVAILYLDAELAPAALLRAGECYEKLGDAAQARKAYDEILRDFPETDHAKTARERLAKLSA